MFRTVSQTMLNYRGSRLSEGRAGGIEGGDRLPWVRAESSDSDNFAPLRSLRWQLHVYGDVSREIQSTCDERGLPVHTFPWRDALAPTGLSRSAFYLIRPDGYVALAGTSQSIDQLRSYLDAHRLKTCRD